MREIQDVLTLFERVKKTGDQQWMVLCPCHDDKKQSLAVSVGKNGNIIFHCGAGCDYTAVMEKVGLKPEDISPRKKSGFDFRHVVATYLYPNGTRKLRDWEKNFMWQHQEGGEWKNGRGNNPHVLYHAGTPAGKVFIVEGQKDADNLSALGYFVVSPESGADKKQAGKKWPDAYNLELKGLEVLILPDHDEAGESFARIIANEVSGVAKWVKVLDLASAWPEMPLKGDVSDLIQEKGAEATRAILEQLEGTTEAWQPGPQATPGQLARPEPTGPEEVRELLEMRVTNHRDGTSSREPACTAHNFQVILEHDPAFSGLCFNTMVNTQVRRTESGFSPWTDSDDAWARTYIEREYGLSNRQKYEDALSVTTSSRKVHPVQEMLSALVWDGKPRVETFLTDWLRCEDTPYTRETSRLIFAGGVNRAFEPGCKFDIVVVLIGSQGGGKSSLVRFLALKDDFYASLKTMSGQKGEEATDGIWIMEIEELLAVIANEKQGAGAEERAKAYLSATKSHYRRPYDRRAQDVPRTCIFIGTTNRNEFLSDKTGNRRWFPVRCHSQAGSILDHEEELRREISQCWAQITQAYKHHDPLARPVERVQLLEVIRQAQAEAEEDDWRIGVISDYLSRHKKEKVCCLQVYCDALHPNDSNARQRYRVPQDSNAIGDILTNKLGWTRGGTSWFGNGYGKQKAYLRPGSTEMEEDLAAAAEAEAEALWPQEKA